MKFASMLRSLRNTQGGGTRPIVSSDPYCPYHPYIANRPELKIVLTFDDGPTQTFRGVNRTRNIMNYLTSQGIIGAFFVQTHALTRLEDGREIPFRGSTENGRETIGLIAQNHIVAVHTTLAVVNPHHSDYYHDVLQGTVLDGQTENELARTLPQGINLIETETGSRPEFIRPPAGEGADDSGVIQTYSGLDLELVMWDIDPERGSGGNAATICDNIDTRMRTYLAGGPKTQMVALFHDPQKVVEDNLPAFIDQIKSVACALGYRPIFNLTKEQVKEVLRAQTDRN